MTPQVDKPHDELMTLLNEVTQRHRLGIHIVFCFYHLLLAASSKFTCSTSPEMSDALVCTAAYQLPHHDKSHILGITRSYFRRSVSPRSRFAHSRCMRLRHYRFAQLLFRHPNQLRKLAQTNTKQDLISTPKTIESMCHPSK